MWLRLMEHDQQLIQYQEQENTEMETDQSRKQEEERSRVEQTGITREIKPNQR